MMERHSNHYEHMLIQPYEVMRSMGVLESYLQASAIKYIMRAGFKAEFVTDIEKAIAVLTDLISEVENQHVQSAE